jgi:hypothetical protein
MCTTLYVSLLPELSLNTTPLPALPVALPPVGTVP